MRRVFNRARKYKSLIVNFNFLAILQLSTLLIPLLIYPYLIRVLGKELYGVIAYSHALIAYFLVFINFGFNISEIRELSICRSEKDKVSGIVSSVLTIKSTLLLISFLVLAVLIFFIPGIKKHQFLYFAYFGILIDGAIGLSFYFQAIEKMKYITYFSLASKLISVSFIIVLVNDPEDYILVPLLNSIGALTSCSFGLYVVFSKHRIKFFIPSFSVLRHHFIQSIPFFTSRFSVLVNSKTNALLIGSFIGYTEVAYYDLAEKVVEALKVPYKIINQVVFPNVAKTKDILFVKRLLRIMILIYLIGYFFLFLGAEKIVLLLGGKDMLPAVSVLLFYGSILIIDLIVVFLGAPILLIMGHSKVYNYSIVLGSISYFLMVLILFAFDSIGIYQLIGVTILSNIVILIFRLFHCLKYNLLSFKIK